MKGKLVAVAFLLSVHLWATDEAVTDQGNVSAPDLQPVSQQQDEPARKDFSLSKVVALDLGTALWGNLGVRYEHKLLRYLSVTVPVDFKVIHLNVTGRLASFSGMESLFPLLLLTVGSGAKFHWEGWFVEPFMKVGYGQIQSSVDVLKIAHVGVIEPGVFAGYQWLPKSGKPGFYGDFGAGITMRFHIYPMPDDVKKPFHDPLLGKPDLRASFGYTW